MIGTIPIDIFNLGVAVFAAEQDRLAALKDEGCVDLSERPEAALASAHMNFTEAGGIRLSMVIKPGATKATWAHECVHIADFVMDYLRLPSGVENTEIRAYLVGHLFSRLEDIVQ